MIKHLTTLFASLENPKLLITVSGGVDSMVLLHLCQQLNIDMGVAHCNFQLRGDDSLGDARFVEQYCEQHSIQFHTIAFDTLEYAQEQGISMEMSARELRYNWFNQLCGEMGYTHIVTGHHANDVVETFFINLTRGTGIHGLSGMKAVNGNLVRPLLPFSRNAIVEYAQAKHLQWREDFSNSDTDITRNRIRHNIIPELEKINPSFIQTMLQNVSHLAEIEMWLIHQTKTIADEIVVEEDGNLLISIKLLKAKPQPKLLLFEFLHPYGFTASQINSIIPALDKQSGKQFISPTHRLIIDRFNLIVSPIEEVENRRFYIDEEVLEIDNPIQLWFRTFAKDESFQFSKSKEMIHLDKTHLSFPLYLRKWQQGDSFMPLGMKNFKKVSDFFIDNKFSLLDKENCWLLLSGEDIIWIVGHRMDERFKITERTKEIVEIRFP